MLSPLVLCALPLISSQSVQLADDDMPRLLLNYKQERALIKGLNSSHYIDRIRSISKLGEFGVRNAVAHIIGKLTDNNPQVRAEAVRVLGIMKVYRVAKKIQVMLMHDPSPLVRAKAATTLGELNYKDARVAIVTLLDRPDIRERIAAIKALGKLGGKGVFKTLVNRLKSGRGEIKEAALYSMGYLNDYRSTSLISRYMDINKPQVQKAAVMALTNLSPMELKNKLNKLLLRNGLDFKITVLASLARIGCHGCETNLSFLIDKGNDYVASEAASTAAFLNIPSVVPIILKRLNLNPSLEGRKKFLWALGRFGSMRAMPIALKYIEDPVPEMRAIALKVLRLLRPRDPEIVGKVIPLVYDNELSVRFQAIKLLGEYGDKRLFSYQLISKLKSPVKKTAYAYSIPWLGKPSEKIIKRLKSWLRIKNHNTKCSAVRALGILKEPSVIPTLLSYLYHQDPALKKASILALSLIGTKDAAGPLKYLISKDRNPEIKAYAWIGLSSLHLSRTQELKILNLYKDSIQKRELKLAFLYSFALQRSSLKDAKSIFEKTFNEYFFTGRNSSDKAELLEVLLLNGQMWANTWLEKALTSTLYRVKSKALIWLAKFRKPLLQSLKTPKITNDVHQKRLKRDNKLMLPFKTDENNDSSGCSCNNSPIQKNTPVSILFFILISLGISRQLIKLRLKKQ